MSISTIGTIKQRHQTAIADNPAYDISANVQKDSYVLASAAGDGFALVKDSAQGDGWGVGFAKFSGPTAPRTFTLPDHDATILTDQAAVSVPQGGTGLAALAAGALLYGAITQMPAMVALPAVAAGSVLVSGASPSWSASPTLTSVTLSGLTATRVPFAGVAGLLGDVAGFTYASGVLSLPTSLAVGTNQATAGAIRMASGFTLQARNAANTADGTILSTDALNKTVICGSAISVNNDGVVSLGNVTAGILMVLNIGSNAVAMFELRGGVHGVREISDPEGIYSITAGTAGFNVYWSVANSRYELENKIGGTTSFYLVMLGVS